MHIIYISPAFYISKDTPFHHTPKAPADNYGIKIGKHGIEADEKGDRMAGIFPAYLKNND